jgi:lysophospholipase L1-like esterase
MVRFRHLFLAAAAATALSCGSAPTVQPSPVIDDPALSCPADLSVTAHGGSSATIAYDIPTAVKGVPPVTVSCTPAAGSGFKIGTTVVTCEATDSRSHKASCNFSVTVALVPQLLKTKFMAFGDSLTEGKTRQLVPSIIVGGDKHFNPDGSYPNALNAKLTDRYQDQTIIMVADGLGGEFAGEGKLRLQADWPQYSPEVLLVMEGTNDLTDFTIKTQAEVKSATDSAIDALRVDITFAKSRGARVFLGTIVSLVPPAPALAVAAVPELNRRIRDLAVEQNVTLVDINAVVPTSMISTTDGIHPKPGSEAYSLIADEWLKAIIATLEVKPANQ